MLNVRRVAGPATEPISLAEARIFLRQDVPGFNGDTLQDPLLESWIRAARRACENEIDKAIGAQSLMTTLPTFASYYCNGGIKLPRGPVRSVDEIRTRAAGGAYAVLDPAVYRVTDLTDTVVLEYGKAWPSAGYAEDSIQIDYTAGLAYPSESDVGVEYLDDDVLTAMRMLIGHYWFYRGAVVEGHIIAELPLGVKALLWPNRSTIGI